MKKYLFSLALVTAVACASATAAYAGEVVDGDGFTLHLPPEFHEAPDSMRHEGGIRIRSRFGTMPIDGTPEVKVYIAGSPEAPTATLLLSRVDLKSSARTVNDLGLKQIQAMEASVPAGFEYRQRKIGSYNAIEMVFSSELHDEEHTARVLSVACGDYVVVVMLHTADNRYRGDDETWDDIVGTLKIVSRSRDLIVYGLIGLCVLVALSIIVRLGRRSHRGVHTWESRFEPSSGAMRPSSSSSSVTFAPDGRTPARLPTAPSVTRPPRRGPPTRKGLRTTLPEPGGHDSDQGFQ